MVDNSFQIGQREFKLSKINAMKQFHIARRIAPLLGELLPKLKEISKLKDQENVSQDEQLETLGKFLGPLMEGLGKLSDKDSEFVLYGLMAAVEMKQAEHGNYARLVVDGRLMFEDIGLDIMLQTAGRAFVYNLSGFFDALRKTS